MYTRRSQACHLWKHAYALHSYYSGTKPDYVVIVKKLPGLSHILYFPYHHILVSRSVTCSSSSSMISVKSSFWIISSLVMNFSLLKVEGRNISGYKQFHLAHNFTWSSSWRLRARWARGTWPPGARGWWRSGRGPRTRVSRTRRARTRRCAGTGPRQQREAGYNPGSRHVNDVW